MQHRSEQVATLSGVLISSDFIIPQIKWCSALFDENTAELARRQLPDPLIVVACSAHCCRTGHIEG